MPFPLVSLIPFCESVAYLLLNSGLSGINGVVTQYVACCAVHLLPSHSHGGGVFIIHVHGSHGTQRHWLAKGCDIKGRRRSLSRRLNLYHTVMTKCELKKSIVRKPTCCLNSLKRLAALFIHNWKDLDPVLCEGVEALENNSVLCSIHI